MNAEVLVWHCVTDEDLLFPEGYLWDKIGEEDKSRVDVRPLDKPMTSQIAAASGPVWDLITAAIRKTYTQYEVCSSCWKESMEHASIEAHHPMQPESSCAGPSDRSKPAFGCHRQSVLWQYQHPWPVQVLRLEALLYSRCFAELRAGVQVDWLEVQIDASQGYPWTTVRVPGYTA